MYSLLSMWFQPFHTQPSHPYELALAQMGPTRNPSTIIPVHLIMTNLNFSNTSLSFFICCVCFTEPTHQNNGKASILGDATRILRDLLAQVECLKRENEALVTESHYVSISNLDIFLLPFLLSSLYK